MSTRVDQLDQLRHEVNLNLAFGAVSDIDLVTNDEGHCPVVVALDSEPLSAILGRLRAVGGYGTVFSRGKAGVRAVSMLHDQCAIPQPADSLIPGPDAEFGMFLDYVARHDDGVCIPAAFDHPAKARDARPVELAEPAGLRPRHGGAGQRGYDHPSLDREARGGRSAMGLSARSRPQNRGSAMTDPDQYRPDWADRVCVDCGRRGPLEYVVVFEGQDHIETWWPTSHVGRGWSHPPCAMARQ